MPIQSHKATLPYKSKISITACHYLEIFDQLERKVRGYKRHMEITLEKMDENGWLLFF